MARGLLAREVLEAQLDQIELLRAMYPEAGELEVTGDTDALLSSLRTWCSNTSMPEPTVPHTISLLLNVDVAEDVKQARCISVSIEYRLCADHSSSDARLSSLRVRQPDWLTKAEVSNISADLPEDDLFSAIDHVRKQAGALVASKRQTPACAQHADQRLVRVWFYFPSISTREKRDDLVNYGPSYGLSGFLLAGKPGVLCLEGVSEHIDNFMKFIKNESWGDIPSQHKKVSERHRQLDVSRHFEGMVEITDQLEKRGQRANRGDMKALECWLDDRGLGDVFSKVLM